MKPVSLESSPSKKVPPNSRSCITYPFFTCRYMLPSASRRR